MECSSGGVPILVTPQWLKSKLDTDPNPSEFMVLDTTWLILGDGKQLYLK